MKYDSGMKAYYNDIAAAIRSMLGKKGFEEIRELAGDSSPVPLREYLKEQHGKVHHSGSCPDMPFMFACTPQNFMLEYDYAINNSGDKELTLSWSQVVVFIKGKKGLIFDDFDTNEHSNADDCKTSYFEALKAVYPNLTIENLLDNPEYDFCPGEFFEGANSLYKSNSCDGDCERCWKQQAAFEYKPAEDFEVPEEWKAVKQDDEEPEQTDEEFEKEKSELEKALSEVNEDKIDCPHYRKKDTLKNIGFGAVRFECRHHNESFMNGRKLTQFLATHCYNSVWCPYCHENKSENAAEQPDSCAEPTDIIPVAAEDNSTAFDYSELDNDTAIKLQKISERVIDIKKKYILDTAKEVHAAHELLANHYGGKFGKWCESIGISRDTGNNYLRVAEIFGNITIEERQTLSQLKPSLLYEVSKPSAPPELVEQVKSGDITTHKKYIELKKQLEEANKRADNAEAEVERAKIHSQQQSESFDRVADQSSKNYNKYLEEYHKNQDLMKQIRELESKSDNAEKDKKIAELKKELKDLEERHDDDIRHSCELEEQIKKLENRPVEVAVEDNSEELSRKDEEIAELREQLERLSDDNVKSLVFRMTFEEYDRLIGIVKASDDYALQNVVNNARLIKI